jgi:hypothetical protein
MYVAPAQAVVAHQALRVTNKIRNAPVASVFPVAIPGHVFSGVPG